MTTVTWSMYLEPDGSNDVYTEHQSELPRWADIPSNGTTTAEYIAQHVWDDEQMWDEWFGLEATQIDVYLHILTPAACAGWYEVLLQRVVKAKAQRIKPKVQAG